MAEKKPTETPMMKQYFAFKAEYPEAIIIQEVYTGTKAAGRENSRRGTTSNVAPEASAATST